TAKVVDTAQPAIPLECAARLQSQEQAGGIGHARRSSTAPRAGARAPFGVLELVLKGRRLFAGSGGHGTGTDTTHDLRRRRRTRCPAAPLPRVSSPNGGKSDRDPSRRSANA